MCIRDSRNPLTDRHKTWQGWLRRGYHPTCKLSYFYPQGGAVLHMREIVILRVYFFTPPLLFDSLRTCRGRTVRPIFVFMAQKTCFRDSYVLFGVRTKNFKNFHYFSPKTRNSLFPQCKTSIGNNSGSIKDRVVKFAYSTGFLTIADRMVWTPSLSRDRKWPRPPIRRKTAFECV